MSFWYIFQNPGIVVVSLLVINILKYLFVNYLQDTISYGIYFLLPITCINLYTDMYLYSLFIPFFDILCCKGGISAIFALEIDVILYHQKTCTCFFFLFYLGFPCTLLPYIIDGMDLVRTIIKRWISSFIGGC